MLIRAKYASRKRVREVDVIRRMYYTPGVSSEVYSVRLPDHAIARLREVALVQAVQPTALVRRWVLERLQTEPISPRRVAEPTVAYASRTVTPFVSARLEQVADACRARGVERLGVFGSATGPRFDPARSDVDVAVSFLPMPPPVHASCFLGLADDLERIFDRRVDLVEEHAVRNPYVRRSIASTVVVVYDSP